MGAPRFSLQRTRPPKPRPKAVSPSMATFSRTLASTTTVARSRPPGASVTRTVGLGGCFPPRTPTMPPPPQSPTRFTGLPSVPTMVASSENVFSRSNVSGAAVALASTISAAAVRPDFTVTGATVTTRSVAGGDGRQWSRTVQCFFAAARSSKAPLQGPGRASFADACAAHPSTTSARRVRTRHRVYRVTVSAAARLEQASAVRERTMHFPPLAYDGQFLATAEGSLLLVYDGDSEGPVFMSELDGDVVSIAIDGGHVFALSARGLLR